jgi:hypothetical protein
MAQHRLLCGCLLATVLAGCYGRQIARTSPPATLPSDLNPPTPVASVEAIAVVPVGWKAEPLKRSPQHEHQVWISPSGDTAYGIIHVHMPLPLNDELALAGFLVNMGRSEGEAKLLSKQTDPRLPGIRFVAEGGRYRLRANLITRDWIAWVIYAGTFREKPVVSSELEQAERAREATIVGLPR